MPWDPEDPDIGYALMETGEPPEKIEEIRDNETWMWIFGCWSNDLDPYANTLYQRLREGEDPAAEIAPWFQEEGRVRFTNAVVDLRGRIIAAERERQKRDAADKDAQLYAEWAAQNAETEGADTKELVIDDAVRAAVRGVNKAELEKLGVGEEVEYRQVGAFVLIGEGQEWAYYNWAYAQDGYAGGTITRKSRRRTGQPRAGDPETEPEKEDATSAYIEVTGCAASDRQAFLDEMRILDTLENLGELPEEKILFR